MSPPVRRFLPVLLILVLVGGGILFSQSHNLKASADGAGCGNFEDLIEMESAYNEARYLPIQVIAVMGVGLGLGFQYSAMTGDVLAADLNETAYQSPDCSVASVVEKVTPTGSGEVKFDLNNCESQSGLVTISQGATTLPDLPDTLGGIELPDPADIPTDPSEIDPDNLPTEVPENPEDLEQLQEDLSELTEEELQEFTESLLSGTATNSAGILFDSFKNGLLEVDGGLVLGLEIGLDNADPDAVDNSQLSAQANSGTLQTQLRASLLDYEGVAEFSGPWSLDADAGTTTLNLTGGFLSINKVTWAMEIEDLVIGGDCLGGKSGSINATYTGPAGTVAMTAEFNGSCDGCVPITIDGQSAGESCLPEIPGVDIGAALGGG